MKLSEILAISGQSGLYKFVAQSKSGIIVESLVDAKRMPVQGTSKVSSLGDIAIFTDDDDAPLSEVFDAIYKGLDGGEAISHKSDAKDLQNELARFLPNYDRERVHVSDMKKLFLWYNILVRAGITNFIEAESNEEESEAGHIEDVLAAKTVTPKATNSVAQKTSGAKIVKQKTAPKAK